MHAFQWKSMQKIATSLFKNWMLILVLLCEN